MRPIVYHFQDGLANPEQLFQLESPSVACRRSALTGDARRLTAADYGCAVAGGIYPGGTAVGVGSDPGGGYAVPLGVGFSAGALFVGIGPAVGSGEAAGEGELTSHPASSASASSNTYTKRRFFISSFPTFFSERR
ncbi:MAG TPA: hypothetical protein VFO07_09985, partial [Roseiflexaceae bacterium]|nr:hypothetical protein [Roseiflexaceae bacterium]